MNTKVLASLATFSFAALVAGIAFNAIALALFAIAVSALVLLIAATDYAEPRPLRVLSVVGARERLPFAA